MVRWKRNGCSRCGGTTYIENDGNEKYEKCLMCSFRVELEKVSNKAEQAAEKETSSR